MRTLALILCLVAAPPAVPAPAPVPKPEVPLERRLEGGWNVTWSEYAVYDYEGGTTREHDPQTGTAWMSRNGFWACHRDGMQYLGTWSVEGDVLIVEEGEMYWQSQNGNHSRYSGAFTYRITLDLETRDKGFVGRFEGGGRLILRP
jgi:hypothetical protein